MNRRLIRLEQKIFTQGVNVDIKDKNSFWRDRYRSWDALGLLLIRGYKFIVAAVLLYEAGRYDLLKKLFMRSLLPNWDKPTPVQLEWGVEAVGRMKDKYREMDWWDGAEIKLEEWLQKKEKEIENGKQESN